MLHSNIQMHHWPTQFLNWATALNRHFTKQIQKQAHTFQMRETCGLTRTHVAGGKLAVSLKKWITHLPYKQLYSWVFIKKRKEKCTPMCLTQGGAGPPPDAHQKNSCGRVTQQNRTHSGAGRNTYRGFMQQYKRISQMCAKQRTGWKDT
jgi:hypothetical protein